jgi:hypothetical protein
MPDSKAVTCRDCLYVEACFALNPELRTHRKDFLETNLCAKQCTTFKAREDYIPKESVSTLFNNLRSGMFSPLNASEVSLLGTVESMLRICKLPSCTDDQLYRISR